jgi:glycosyltransferase involved in cell wall biosynthesis
VKPRIVILSAFATPYRSGAEACSEEVSAALKGRYDFTIVTARLSRSLPKKGVLQSGVQVVRVGLGCRADKWLYPLLAPFVTLRLRPQVIHAVLESYAGLALILCKFIVPRTKRMLTCQSTNTTLFVGSMHCFADAITAISNALVTRAKKFGRSDVTLISNGLTLQSMPRMQKIPGSILFVGRHEPMKGIDTLLRAFAQVSVPGTHLRLVGEGSVKKPMEALAKELGIQDRVEFLGFVPMPDVYEEFAQAQIFCGLSRSEALGNVFLEAQAAECAVIGTRVGGIPDIVEDGKTGILTEPDNVEEAAHAITKLLSDEPLRTALAAEGMRHASHFDWSQIAEKYAAVYDSLLAK